MHMCPGVWEPVSLHLCSLLAHLPPVFDLLPAVFICLQPGQMEPGPGLKLFKY